MLSLDFFSFSGSLILNRAAVLRLLGNMLMFYAGGVGWLDAANGAPNLDFTTEPQPGAPLLLLWFILS